MTKEDLPVGSEFLKVVEQKFDSGQPLEVKEVEAIIARALIDSRKPNLDPTERLRLRTVVKLGRTYLSFLATLRR